MRRAPAESSGPLVAPLERENLCAEHQPPLTGWQGSPEYFRFREHTSFRPESIVDVLRGRVQGVVFRSMVDPATCAELTTRFWNSPARRTRGADAPGHYVGAYHYHKTTDDYLDQTAAVKRALDDILDVPADPLAYLNDGLTAVLATEGVDLRLARHAGRDACRAILRSWHGQDVYALAPHEDHGQCTEPKQANFEIQRVVDHHVVALNMCLENGAGGRLVVWNIQPDAATKQRLGLHYTGSPYPLESLNGIEAMWLDVHPGDVYLFNGSAVHAVEPGLDRSVTRITLSGILGFVDDRTVVSWT